MLSSGRAAAVTVTLMDDGLGEIMAADAAQAADRLGAKGEESDEGQDDGRVSGHGHVQRSNCSDDSRTSWIILDDLTGRRGPEWW